MADITEKLNAVISESSEIDALCKEAAAEIARLRATFAPFQQLAVATYAAVLYAIPYTDGRDGVAIPREQFNNLTAALARVGLTH